MPISEDKPEDLQHQEQEVRQPEPEVSTPKETPVETPKTESKKAVSAKSKKDPLVGETIYLKNGAYWNDDLTGITLRNMPESTRWVRPVRGNEPTLKVIPGSTKEERTAEVPDGKDLEGIYKARKLGVIDILSDEEQLNDVATVKPEGYPLNKEEAIARGLDHWYAEDGTVIHVKKGSTAYDLLQQPNDKLLKSIISVTDFELLKSMLALEKQGGNLANHPRAHVVDAIEKRIREGSNVSGVSINRSPEMLVSKRG